MELPAETESQANQDNPYLGPRPFTRADAYRFFGREREAAEACSLVAAHRTVLLYSQSGAGKSSLLHAGTIPRLEERGFDTLPTARVSGAPEEGLPPGVDNIYVFNCRRFWDDDAPAGATLAGMLASRPRRKDASGTVLPRVAVFDQFEELFTAYPGKWQQREGFFSQLDEAMRAEPTLRVLFAMREDFVAHLDPYEDQLPEELRTRYRLEQLREEAALAAVQKPVELTGIRFKAGVAEALVGDLLSVPSGEAGTGRVRGEFVDPVQLQVACFSLFRNLPPATTEITKKGLKAYGNVDLALREFYRDALRETAKQTGVEEDSLRQWFETRLLTEAGTRGLVFRGDDNTGGIPNAAVDLLENTHIIRPDVRGRDRWYELSHDRFIQPILRANDEWRGRVKEKALAEAQQRAAEEAARLERELARERELEQTRLLATEQKVRADLAARSAKRLRRGVIVLVTALFVVLAAMDFAFVQRKSALEAQEQAKKELTRANQEALNAKWSQAERDKAAQFYDVAEARRRSDTHGTKPNVDHPLVPAGQSPPPKHLIVLMMENRSFDHMLGALKAADPRIDGLNGDESNPDPAGDPVTVQPLAAFQGQLTPDPDHSFPAVNLQIFGGASLPSHPNMQGFVQSYSRERILTRNPALLQQANTLHSHNVMYYFPVSKLPVLATLAKEFAVCDRWFSSVPGPSLPNHFFAHYGTSFGRVDMTLPSGQTRIESIQERLVGGGRKAKIYYYDQQSPSMGNRNLMQAHPEMFGTFQQFLADAGNGSLPDYSFIEPNYNDHQTDTGSQIASDEHPDHSVQAGELFIAEVYNAIKRSPLWHDSLLVITYSTHGGLYDHLPPPAVVPDVYEADAVQTGVGVPFRFDRLGVRVPAVIISPYIARGTVDHTVYEHASIPATASKLFLKGQQNVSPRERDAHTFDHVLTLAAPRTDTPDFNVN